MTLSEERPVGRRAALPEPSAVAPPSNAQLVGSRVLPVVVTAALLVMMIPVGVGGGVGAILAIGAVVYLTLLFALGFTGTGILFVWIAMLLGPFNNMRLGSSQVTISDVTLFLGFGTLIPTLVRQRVRFPTMFVVGLIVVLVTGTIATVAAPIPIVSAGQLFRLVIGAFALAIFMMAWRPSARLIASFGGAYIAGSAVSTFYGLAQGPIEGRYIGYTTHPNYYGLACLLAVCLTPYVATVYNSRPVQVMLWGLATISALGVWLSGSRAALLVLIMLGVVFPFVERSVHSFGVIVAGFAGVLAFSGRLLSESSDNALGRLLGNGTASGSDTEREQILSEAWHQFLERPIIGNGFDGGLGSHNIYLQIAVAIGIFGFVGYLMILWSGFRLLFNPGPAHRMAYPIIAYMAIGPLTNTLWDRLIWIVVALTYATVVLTREEEVAAQEASAPAQTAVTERGRRG